MNLQLYPMSMERFGNNPYGDPMWRIVFSDSRRFIVSGTWPDGATYASEESLYPQHPQTWILERWLPAAEFAGCLKEAWDRTYPMLGPYPERGDYNLCHAFEVVGPADSNLDKLIMWIEEGRKRSFQEIKDGCQAAIDNEKKATRSTQEAMIRDSLSAHLDFPMVGPHGARGTKTRNFNLTPRDIGLPSGGNKFVSTRTEA